jgi:hypothetical protein
MDMRDPALKRKAFDSLYGDSFANDCLQGLPMPKPDYSGETISYAPVVLSLSFKIKIIACSGCLWIL